MKITVVLNGTDSNHWHKMNLRMNPFPQVAKHELTAAMMQLNSLDGDPIKGPEDIEARLEGWSPEFIELCKQQFKPGKRVRFDVTIPE